MDKRNVGFFVFEEFSSPRQICTPIKHHYLGVTGLMRQRELPSLKRVFDPREFSTSPLYHQTTPPPPVKNKGFLSSGSLSYSPRQICTPIKHHYHGVTGLTRQQESPSLTRFFDPREFSISPFHPQ
ncbi:hypothetical protein TWF506_006709 [Arthrobotrys conoides]|uniref:Uncharacterized protein n=1 Tax=Arthrobotrys conoides TaxID=74498 RepID=A0AAN8PLX5_9PEZI